MHLLLHRSTHGEATLALLHEIDRQILQNQPLDSVMRYMCEQLAGRFGYPAVCIGMPEPDGTLQVRAYAGDGEWWQDIQTYWQQVLGRGESLTHALHAGKPQVCHLPAGPTTAGRTATGLARTLRAVLFLPLVTDTQIQGVLTLFADRVGVFRGRTVNHLNNLADQIALSLLAARQREQIHLQTVALEAAANAVVITDREGTISWVNPAFTRLTGYSAAEVVGQNPRLMKSGNHSPEFYRHMWQAIRSGQVWQSEVVNRRKDGTLYIEEMTITPVLDARGDTISYIAIKQDITKRKRQEQRIRFLAMHDPLTALPNRRALEERLQQLHTACCQGRPGAVLLLDLDDFKVVNDTLGHAAGDQLLVHLTQVLRASLRPPDFLARLGGDEFAVVLSDTGMDEAQAVAERLRRGVDDFRFESGNHVFDPSVSIGIAPVDGTRDPRAVLGLADAALYAAKDGGRNRVTVYRSPQDRRGDPALANRWATRIKAALREDRFVLHFQPVVRVHDGRIEYFEALVRMVGEDGSLIFPGEFLASAQRFHLMPQLDRWVVAQVLGEMRRDPALKVFVNLSGDSLGDDSFLDFLADQLQRGDVAAQHLAFEVTETAVFKDRDRMQDWMTRLKELGCRIALDDFGMGLSSFLHLRALPADYVKIDGSFMANLDTDPINRALVQAIHNISSVLGKRVIAEWVETETVAAELRGIGIELGQGYLWGPPEAGIACRYAASPGAAPQEG